MDHLEETFLDDHDSDSMLEMLGLDTNSMTVKDYGRERGAAPDRSDAQIKALEKLASRVTHAAKEKKHKDEDDAIVVSDFNMLDKPRTILFQGKVNKKSMHSMVTHRIVRFGGSCGIELRSPMYRCL